jgi:hypothetical protein
MRTLYTFFFIFIVSICSGQNDSVTQYKNQLKLSPLRVFGLDPGVDLSYERLLSSQFSIQITGRYVVDMFRLVDNLHGFGVYLEPRYYINTSATSRTFVSLNVGYLNCQYKTEEDFMNPNADSINKLDYDFVDTVLVKRQTAQLTLNYGVQKYYKRFVFEFSAGLGIRYRESALSDKLYADQYMFKNRHHIFGGPNEEGYFFTPLIPLRFKVGYRF